MAPLLEHRKLPPQPQLPEAMFQIRVDRQQLQPPPCARTSGHSEAPPRLLRPLLLAPIIGIVGLVVHYQLVVDEVKAVRTGLIGIFNHQTNDILRKLGKLIDVLASVPAARDAEAEIKVKIFQQAFPEVVPLDHPEV